MSAFSFKLIKQTDWHSLRKQHEALLAEVEKATQFIKDMESGQSTLDKLTHDYSADSELFRSLHQMFVRLQKLSEAEKERKWVTEGIANFLSLMRNNNSELDELTNQLLSNMVRYMEASMGAIFIFEEKANGEEVLKMLACYAYDRKKYINIEIKPGEGLIGQVAIEKASLHLDNIPEGYIKINSGLGAAEPRSLLLVPMKIDERVFGVIEIASLRSFKDYQVEFLERIAENMASTIANLKASKKTRELLEQSQQQTEEMRAQEEEMRQNLEELQATQEEMQRKTLEIERMNAKLSSSEDILRKAYSKADSSVKELARKNKEVAEKEAELQKNIEELHQAQALLKQAENRLFRFLKAIPVGVFIIDTQYKPYFANEYATQLLGKGIMNVDASVSSSLDQVFKTVVAGTDQEYPAEKLPVVRALQGEVSTINDMEIVHTDNKRIHLQVTGQPIKDDDGSIAFAMAIFIDISQQVAQQEQIKKQYSELVATEEELRQNMEELHSTQELLQVQKEELAQSNKRLAANEAILKAAYTKNDQVRKNLEAQIATLSQQTEQQQQRINMLEQKLKAANIPF
jgi:methyl-accepting chemotaxis protein